MAASTFSVVKTLIVPAIISLIIFLVSTYVLYPLWQQYRHRYSQYLPLETISDRTLSIRTRMQNAIARFATPSAWRRSGQDRIAVADSGSDAGFDSDDGEELGEVNDDARDSYAHGRHAVDSTRRLSRDLEEGFMDDSDEEGGQQRSGRH